MIAAYAWKTFQVSTDSKYTFSDFQYTTSHQSEKQDVEGSKPSTYDKGLDLDSMSFKVQLDVLDGINPRNEWESWKSLCGSHYPFILGSTPLGGYEWQLISVSPGNLNIDGSGNILSMELSLEFQEYVRAGYRKDDTGAQSPAPGLYDGMSETAYQPYEPDADYKEEFKEDNPGMSWEW